jgi:molecular chaperone DnaK (HSP70)
LQKAQVAKDRAEEELVAARACCSSVGEGGDGEVDPKIAEMEGYLQNAKDELAEAKKAAEDAEEQYQKAVALKGQYAAEKVKIEKALEDAKKAMDNAEEEYKEA